MLGIFHFACMCSKPNRLRTVVVDFHYSVSLSFLGRAILFEWKMNAEVQLYEGKKEGCLHSPADSCGVAVNSNMEKSTVVRWHEF